MKQVIQIAWSSAASLLVSSAFAAAPVVSDVTMTQDANRKVLVTYRLDAPAVVTLDVETNVVGTAEWVSIGRENLTHVTGEANVFVRETDSSTIHAIQWQPTVAWPNHRIRGEGVRAVVRAWAPEAPPDWMLIDLSMPSNVHYYASMAELPFGHPTNVAYKTTKLLMRKVQAAGRTFRMGISYGEARQDFNGGGDFADVYGLASPRLVSFTNDYYLAVFPFTQSQFFNALGENPSEYDTGKAPPYDECPTTSYSYDRLRGNGNGILVSPVADWPNDGHAVEPNSRFDKVRQRTGVEVDLPTEAQWEYACRAGEERFRYDGAALHSAPGLEDLCWYDATATDGKMRPVGLKRPNAWGFYDMYGNGLEWCLDWFSYGYRDCGTLEPVGPASGVKRVARGKQVTSDSRYMNSVYREGYEPCGYVGFSPFTFRFAAPAVAR